MTIITEGIEQSQVLGKFPGPFWEGRFFCRGPSPLKVAPTGPQDRFPGEGQGIIFGPSPFTHATFPKT